MDGHSEISATDIKLFESVAVGAPAVDELVGKPERIFIEDFAESGPSRFETAMHSPAPSLPTPGLPSIPERITPPPPGSPTSTPPAQKIDVKRMFQDTQFVPAEFGDIDVGEENRNQSIRREKQEILFQLLKMYKEESRGQWTMQLPLFELKYELSRRQQFQEEQTKVDFMREMMKMILVGLEFLNKQFGPFLDLDGWSSHVTKDMSKYDRCLKLLYHRYFKKAQMNPIMELLWLLVGSAAMWHIQSKFMGGPPRATPAPTRPAPAPTTFFNNLADIQPPPGTNATHQEPPKSGGGVNIGSLLKMFAGMGG